MPGKLGCVIVAVDGSEESMSALKWALDNLKLRSPAPDSAGGSFVILHVQSPPSIAAGLNPGDIPFGGPSDLEVPAFTAAIEAHQGRITKAIMAHALQICTEKNVEVKTQVVVGDARDKICEIVEDLHADLLVMGSRTFGPIRRESICGGGMFFHAYVGTASMSGEVTKSFSTIPAYVYPTSSMYTIPITPARLRTRMRRCIGIAVGWRHS